jgi:lipid-binding SYLF domain-containing protein
MQRRLYAVLSMVLFAFMAASATAVAGWDPEEKSKMISKAEAAVADFKKTDPSMSKFFDKAYGYAIYPDITKGGFIVGGASGRGVVYVGGKAIAGSRMSQGTFGAQIGGQSYRQIIFFESEPAFDRFKNGSLKFSAQATAVAATAGAAKAADYEDGVAVFTLIKGGLMAEASIGGQDFSYEPF